MMRIYSFSTSAIALSVVLSSMLIGCQASPAQTPIDLSPMSPVAAEMAAKDKAYAELETRVRQLEGQMRAAQPKLQKVDKIENHFKTLSLELDRISTHYEMPNENVQASAPIPSPVTEVVSVPVAPKNVIAEKPVLKKEVANPPKAASAQPAVPAGVLAVTSVRIGAQPKNITRIVLDTTKAATIHYDLDNAEGLLVIDIPSAQWKTTEKHSVKQSSMVSSFNGMADSDGAHLVLQLKQKAKVLATARLTPSGSSGNRVYIDIAPAK